MKRFILFITPFLIAVLIFLGILFFLERRTGKGALQVTSVPESKVYLDGKLVGTTKYCACDASSMLSQGDYTIKLVPEEGNFKPFEEKITINRSTLTAIDRTFNDNEGSEISLSFLNDKEDTEIMVISIPDKANVFLDGNPVGVTPLLLKQVAESDHDLKVALDGYRDKSLKIKTSSGFKLTAQVYLGINTDLTAPQTASPTASLVATPSAMILILNTPTGFLRVRESNSINSPEIAQVKPGESYELVSETEGWFKIKLTDGKIGWVSSSYAAKE
jgi:hypothetical protein